MRQLERECPDCHGDGRVRCPECQGTEAVPCPCLDDCPACEEGEADCRCHEGKVECGSCGGRGLDSRTVRDEPLWAYAEDK